MGIGDSIQGFLGGDTAGATEVIKTSVVSGLSFLSKLVWYVAIFGIIAFVAWIFLFRYKGRAQIKIYRAGKLHAIKTDMVREFIDIQGKRKLQLFWCNKTMPKPQQRFIYRKGKKDFYELVQDDNGELHAYETDVSALDGKKEIEVEEKAKGIFNRLRGKKVIVTKQIQDIAIASRFIPQERVAWLLSENKLLEDKIKSKERWKELMAIALPYVGLAIMFLIFYFGFKELGGGMNNMASQFGQIATNCLS